MELRWHLPHVWRREVDWSAAAVAGLGAGALLMVVELLWAASTGDDGPWRISQLIAALVLGPGLAQQPPAFDLGVTGIALAIHYGLGIVFGLLLGQAVARWHANGHPITLQAIGAAFGALLYLVNFHALTLLFPWFAELRGWSTFMAHLVFGVSAALLYWRLARPGSGDARLRMAGSAPRQP